MEDGIWWVRFSNLKNPESPPILHRVTARKRYVVPGLVVIGSTLPVLKPSRHRSKRVRKKLNKQLSTPLYGRVVHVSLFEDTIKRLRAAANLQEKYRDK